MHSKGINEEAVYKTFFSLKAYDRFREAAEVLLPLVEVKRDDPTLLFLIGSTLYLDEQYSPALSYLNKAISINPGHALASLGLFHTLARLNKWAPAFEELNRFLSIRETNSKEHLLLLN